MIRMSEMMTLFEKNMSINVTTFDLQNFGFNVKLNIQQSKRSLKLIFWTNARTRQGMHLITIIKDCLRAYYNCKIE